LGHVKSEAGIHTDPDKIAAIQKLKPPSNPDFAQRFSLQTDASEHGWGADHWWSRKSCSLCLCKL